MRQKLCCRLPYCHLTQPDCGENQRAAHGLGQAGMERAQAFWFCGNSGLFTFFL
jgi:hypothetical protein